MVIFVGKFSTCIWLSILKDCYLGYLNLEICSPIEFCRGLVAIYFDDIEKTEKLQ